jgi:peroxiredoxin
MNDPRPSILRPLLALPLLGLLVAGACGGENARTDAGQGTEQATNAGTTVKTDAAVEEGRAAGFRLTDTEGEEHALESYLETGRIVVLEWFNPDCPFVKKHHQSHRTMAQLEDRYSGRGVVWLAINSGAPGKQGAGLDRNVRAREECGIDYPVLLDESGRVGRLYGAKTTPHMYVIEPGGSIVYQGAIDDERGTKQLGKTNFVEKALEQLLAGESIAVPYSAPYGCSVKYGESRPASM